MMTSPGLNPDERAALAVRLRETKQRQARRKLRTFYPDEGPLRRALYPKHLRFFALGRTHNERLFMAANRVGKTEGVGGYETALHLTGRYPDWWEGRRFAHPISAWAAGKTSEATRDAIQAKLFGPVEGSGPSRRPAGTGLVPGEDIRACSWKTGVADLLDTVRVQHVSGGWSTLGLKAYPQGRGAFEGTEQHLVWLDEEPPMDIYTECLIRTMTTDGLVLLTFTPLAGLSELVLSFLPGGPSRLASQAPQVGRIASEESPKAVVTATWEEVPHLSEAQRQTLLASIPPYERDARTKGVPQLGAGAIFPVPESDFVVAPFRVPVYWPRVYGLDVGWTRTAAVWAAIDRETDTAYLYSEYYRGQAEPAVHAEAIRARGAWIHGVVDPAARGRLQSDGERLLEAYVDLGLLVTPADNGVESGLFEVWQRLSSGRLKVFATLANWLAEFRLYRRDEKGHVVKENDHLMDATRYLVVSGLGRATADPRQYEEYERDRGLLMNRRDAETQRRR